MLSEWRNRMVSYNSSTLEQQLDQPNLFVTPCSSGQGITGMEDIECDARGSTAKRVMKASDKKKN